MSLIGVLAFLAATASAGLAGVVLWRELRSPAKPWLVLGLCLLAAECVFVGLSVHALQEQDFVLWQRLRLLVLSLQPSTWMAFALTYARSREHALETLHRYWPLLTAVLAVPLTLTLVFWDGLIAKVGLLSDTGEWALRLALPGIGVYVMSLLGLVLALTYLEQTFRSAAGMARWAIKFSLLGLATIFAVKLYTMTQALLFHGVRASFQAVDCAGALLGALLITRSLLREGLFKVQIYPSRTVLYQSLTFVLVGVYLFVVGVLGHLAKRFEINLAIPLSGFLLLAGLVGLAVLYFSDRARQAVHRFIGRHFRRPHYDARQLWMKFADETASRIDEGELGRAVCRWISETFQVLSVSFWVLDAERNRLRMAASTLLGETQAHDPGTAPTIASEEVLAELRRLSYPQEIEQQATPWMQALRAHHKGRFPHGGDRVYVPLTAQDELMGVMLLGDRVRGMTFSVEEFDLLKCIGNELGGHLLAQRLARRLIEARELEAFQTMSTFFIHDLKNTASSLSLLLQNLRDHFDNPEFREDAMRAVSRGAERLNSLIQRLTLLRQKLEIHPAPGDLDELVRAVLKECKAPNGVRVIHEPGHLPELKFDADQIQKVVLNLVLNAIEAVNGQGEIRIASRRRDRWAELSVTDNGCGMPREFIERSLFRPFQTTKKKGLGIGLFQSKMIVEAHGGRMEVESEPGRGTTFRVLLPWEEVRP